MANLHFCAICFEHADLRDDFRDIKHFDEMLADVDHFAGCQIDMNDRSRERTAHRQRGQAVRGIFDAISIPHATVETPDDVTSAVRLAGKTAFATRTCGACLLPRKVTTAASPQVDRRRGLTS